MKRTLTLRRETLSVLDAGELANVAGANHTAPRCQIDLATLVVATVRTLLHTIPCH